MVPGLEGRGQRQQALMALSPAMQEDKLSRLPALAKAVFEYLWLG